MTRPTVSLVALALTMAADIGCGSYGYSLVEVEGTVAAVQTADAKPAVAAVGDTVGDGVWEFRVTNVRFEGALTSSLYFPSRTFTADAGYQFLVIETELRDLIDDRLYFSTESMHLVQEPDFRVLLASLASGTSSGWIDGSLTISHPGGRDKTTWSEVGLAFHIKRIDAHDLLLQFRDLTPIDLGLE